MVGCTRASRSSARFVTVGFRSAPSRRRSSRASRCRPSRRRPRRRPARKSLPAPDRCVHLGLLSVGWSPRWRMSGPLIRSGAMPKLRTSSDTELLLHVDRDSHAAPSTARARPPRRIRSGRLRAGTVLPSTRALAAAEGLSPRRRRRGLRAVDRRGLPRQQPRRRDEGRQGRGVGAQVDRRAAGGRPSIDFFYGRPDISSFPQAAWLRSIKRVFTEMPNDRLVGIDGRGAHELPCRPRGVPRPRSRHRRRPRPLRHVDRLRPGFALLAGVLRLGGCGGSPSRTRRTTHVRPPRSRRRAGGHRHPGRRVGHRRRSPRAHARMRSW